MEKYQESFFWFK